mmetsp:Transcript_40370/g.108334  ORF Transcript_40370/g.108334 Transcript_40370/m.108334 type:complete len:129 (+) Transcript_40370:1081-1467(+)
MKGQQLLKRKKQRSSEAAAFSLTGGVNQGGAAEREREIEPEIGQDSDFSFIPGVSLLSRSRWRVANRVWRTNVATAGFELRQGTSEPIQRRWLTREMRTDRQTGTEAKKGMRTRACARSRPHIKHKHN